MARGSKKSKYNNGKVGASGSSESASSLYGSLGPESPSERDWNAYLKASRKALEGLTTGGGTYMALATLNRLAAEQYSLRLSLLVSERLPDLDYFGDVLELLEDCGFLFDDYSSFHYQDAGSDDWREVMQLVHILQDYMEAAKKGTIHSHFIDPLTSGVNVGVCRGIERLGINRKEKTWRYGLGEWVEVRNHRMYWRLTAVTERLGNRNAENRIVGRYSTHLQWPGILESDHAKRWSAAGATHAAGVAIGNADKMPELEGEQICIRLPQESVTQLFGVGPWIWQQWACLQLEQELRFQNGHKKDFELLDIPKFALNLWHLWLNHKHNVEFREFYRSVGPYAQEELLRHVMDPFLLMHSVVNNATGEWDFENTRFSVFYYVALLGSGFADAFMLVFLGQVLIPLNLLMHYLNRLPRYGIIPIIGDTIANNDDFERNEEVEITGTRAMLCLVLLYYLYKVSRDLWVPFKQLHKAEPALYSKIMSIRRQIWSRGLDTKAQSLGYTIEFFMKSSYVPLLYMFNIFILFNSSDAFEILGNVIIFEFVIDLDESIASSAWWDKRRRWVKAGVLEILLQLHIVANRLDNKRRLVAHYAPFTGSDYADVFRRALEKNDTGKSSKKLFRLSSRRSSGDVESPADNLNTIDMTMKETRDRHDRKKSRTFGTFSCFSKPVFEKHSKYYDAPLWNDILFAAPLMLAPSALDSMVSEGTYKAGKKISKVPRKEYKSTSADLRYWEGDTELSIWKRIRAVMCCAPFSPRDMGIKEAPNNCGKKAFTSIFFQVYEYLCYVIQLSFAPVVLLAIVAAITPAYCTLNINVGDDCGWMDTFFK